MSNQRSQDQNIQASLVGSLKSSNLTINFGNNLGNNIGEKQNSQKSDLNDKQSQKQLLKREILFLKQQVKKLKIDKLNQKILYEDERKVNPNQLQDNPQSSSEQTENLYNRQTDNQLEKQSGIKFRVGRIVKNNQAHSQARNNTQFSKTIEVRRKNNSEVNIFNQNTNSRQSSACKKSEIQSQQLFRTIESRQKSSFLEDLASQNAGPQPQKIPISQLKKEKQTKKSGKMQIDFDQTVKSVQFNKKNNTLSRIRNEDTDRQFTRSLNIKIPGQFSRLTNKNDKISLVLANPQYQEQQIGDIMKQKSVNIRKVSYKIKSKNLKNPANLRKQHLFNNFIAFQAQQAQQNLPNRYEDIQSYNNNLNVNFQQTKNKALQNKSFKSRLLSKSKMIAIHNEAQKQRKLKGKIIKNFGSMEFQPEQQFEQFNFEDDISPSQIPQKVFSLSQMPFLGDKAHSKSNQGEIIQMTLRVCKKLCIPIKRDSLQSVVIKKFRNCLIFTIPQTSKKIIWYYQGKLYIGEGSKQGQEGYKSGEGVEYIPQKSFYSGQFLQSKRHGSGVIITANGEIYEGQWAHGQRHGNGKHFDPNLNHVYQGQFKEGKFDGYGILAIFKNEIYKGTFLKGLKHGYGLQYFKNGDKYRGQYKNGKFHGKGLYKWSNDSIYEGIFVNGIRTGNGKWKSAQQNADIYMGMYLNDKKHGLGKYCWSNGSIFEGFFQNDMKHGEGLLTYEDGKVVSGKWEANKLVQVHNQEAQKQTTQQVIYKGQSFDKVSLPQKTGNQLRKSRLLRNF